MRVGRSVLDESEEECVRRECGGVCWVKVWGGVCWMRVWGGVCWVNVRRSVLDENGRYRLW